MQAPFDAIGVAPLFDVSVDLICELLRVSGKQLSAADDAEADEADHEAVGEQATSTRFAAQTSAERQGALALAGQLVPLVLRLRAAFVGGTVDRDDDATFAAYTRIFAELGEYYVSQFMAQGSPEALAMISVLLDCASHRSIEIFAITARFWTLLAREIVDDPAKCALYAPA